jgi:hypothetical protein
MDKPQNNKETIPLVKSNKETGWNQDANLMFLGFNFYNFYSEVTK